MTWLPWPFIYALTPGLREGLMFISAAAGGSSIWAFPEPPPFPRYFLCQSHHLMVHIPTSSTWTCFNRRSSPAATLTAWLCTNCDFILWGSLVSGCISPSVLLCIPMLVCISILHAHFCYDVLRTLFIESKVYFITLENWLGLVTY